MSIPPYSYWPISERPPLEFPGGKKLAFYIALNVEHFVPGLPAIGLSNLGVRVDPMNHGWRDYGTRVGIWRMIELLDALELSASVLLNADACAEYPQIVEAGVQRGWTWLAHGRTNSQLWAELEIEQERALLRSIVDDIESATGSRPRGWLGPGLTETENTPRLLGELGFDYVLDWIADDQPFPLRVDGGHRMISVPYPGEINDLAAFLLHHWTARQFAEEVMGQFACLHRESRRRPGAVMALSLHPFLMNVPFRHEQLEPVLAHIRSFDDVWFPSTDEIADWYLADHYEAALAAQSSPIPNPK